MSEYAKSSNLSCPEDVACPTPESKSMEGLSVFDDWCCMNCDHACVKKDSMEKHCETKHE